MSSVAIFGFANSMILALTAIGFSFVFSISGIANFAYGALYILAGFLTFSFLKFLSLPYWISALLPILIVPIIAMAIFWFIIRRIKGDVLLEVVATMGIGVTLVEILRWTDGFGDLTNYLPSFIVGGITIGDTGIEYQRLFIILVGLALFLALWIITHYTKFGLALRAMSQEELTALSLGHNTNRLGLISMGIGGALAAVAAVTIIPLGFLSIDASYDVLIFALAVGVVGGLGSTMGIIVGSFILGYAHTLASVYISPRWMMVVIFLTMIIVLVFKPSGVLGKHKELEERI